MSRWKLPTRTYFFVADGCYEKDRSYQVQRKLERRLKFLKRRKET